MAVMVLVMVIMVLLVGLIMAITPWIMPPTECFAVTVPPSTQRDPRIMRLKRSFSWTVAATTAVSAGTLALMMREMGEASGADLARFSLGITLATLAPIIVGLVLMLRCRKRVQELKQQEAWTAGSRRAAAVMGSEAPGPISLAWNLLYVPIVLGFAAFALLSYDQFPEQIPMNISIAGTATQYAPKSVGTVLFPAIMAAFLGIVFTFSHWMMFISKTPVDPAAPATSALAYGRFVRIQSLATLIGGLTLTLAIGVPLLLSSLERISLTTASLLIMVATLAIVAGEVAVSSLTGQAGGRLAAELRPTDEVAQDNDGHWPFGIFYANADDASVIVPKRFGVGWTINMAHPAAWALMGGLLLFVAAFSLLMTSIGA